MSKEKLELIDIVRTFRDVHALDSFSLSVKRGELVSLLGPSGCGKTTALRIIAGLDHQDSGTIFVDGSDLSDIPTHRRNMGMVFQQYSLFPNLNVKENIAFGLSIRGATKKSQHDRTLELLELIGLPGLGHRLPHQLSGGQQQRVALARALAYQPEILLLDEPLSALDAQVRVQIRGEIRRIQRDMGITTIFVTHDQEEAMAISDRVAVMNHGRLEQIDTPDALYNKPESPFVASFVGIVNRIPGKMVSSEEVQILRQEVAVSKHSQIRSKGSKVHALIRPENIRVVSRKESQASHGVVIQKSFQGPNTWLEVSLGGFDPIKLHLESREAKEFSVGDEISIKVNAEKIMVDDVAE